MTHLQLADADLLEDARGYPGFQKEPASEVDAPDLAIGALLAEHCLRPNNVRHKCHEDLMLTFVL